MRCEVGAGQNVRCEVGAGQNEPSIDKAGQKDMEKGTTPRQGGAGQSRKYEAARPG